MASSVTVLGMPQEIRLLIWHYTVDYYDVHVSLDSAKGCLRRQQGICTSPHTCHQHLAYRDARCTQCLEPQPASWFTCCRQIYLETRNLRFERTAVSFASGQALCQLNLLSPTFLRHLRQVRLDLGPAKYGDPCNNLANRNALRALSLQVPCLQHLCLTMAFYHKAQTDRILMSARILKILVGFKGLRTLDLHLEQPPPAPVAGLFDAKTLDSMRFRVQSLEIVLRHHLCCWDGLPHAEGRNNNCVTPKTVRDQTIALIACDDEGRL